MAQVANENTGSGAAPAVTDSVFQDKSNLWALALGSVGVVYGDIGTSPLYAFRVAVVAAVESGPVRRDIVLGVLSLIVCPDRGGGDQIRASAAAGRQQRGG